jgi:hypothetical protein
MILKYYLPQENYSFSQLDRLSDKVPGKWTWATRALINLYSIGFDIIDIELFDWDKFSHRGLAYLEEIFGHEVAQKQAQMSDLVKEMHDAAEFVRLIPYQQRIPEFADINQLLKQGYLIGCNVNSHALNQIEGYEGHVVLIYKIDQDYIYLHDPGLPPIPNRKVRLNIFQSAWDYPDNKVRNLTAFKFSKHS